MVILYFISMYFYCYNGDIFFMINIIKFQSFIYLSTLNKIYSILLNDLKIASNYTNFVHQRNCSIILHGVDCIIL